MSRLPTNFTGLREISAQPWSDGVKYRLGCICGAPLLAVKATKTTEAEFLDPVSVRCESCGSTSTIFDSSRDGHDGRLNDGACYEQGKNPTEVSCATCGETLLELYSDLAYNIDFEEEGYPEYLAMAPDLFDWITISVNCPKGHPEQELGSWEMA
jgi:ribosomal protein S27E